MSYYETGNSVFSITASDDGIKVVVRTTNTSKIIQLYIGGVLADFQKASPDKATFYLSASAEIGQAYFLAVDESDAQTNYFRDAFPIAATAGNRIKVWQIRELTFGLGDRWRVYVDDVKLTDQPIFPGGRLAVGFGDCFGWNFGLGGRYAPGFGVTPFGLDDFGVAPGCMEYITEPMASGTYTVKTSFVDSVGNESTKSSDSKTITTYARPASDLVVSAYDQGTDTLTISFTESEDF
jgi:hypothetical protein